MGCGVSRPVTEEGSNGRGEFKMIIRRTSIRSGVVADSFTLNKQFLESPARNKDSRPGCDETETAQSVVETESDKENNRGSDVTDDVEGDDYNIPENSILLCPGSPSFRIYCIIPDPPQHDSDAYDIDNCVGSVIQIPQSKCQSDHKKHKMRRREARRRIGRGIKNMRKLLTNPVASVEASPKPSTRTVGV